MVIWNNCSQFFRVCNSSKNTKILSYLNINPSRVEVFGTFRDFSPPVTVLGSRGRGNRASFQSRVGQEVTNTRGANTKSV